MIFLILFKESRNNIFWGGLRESYWTLIWGTGWTPTGLELLGLRVGISLARCSAVLERLDLRLSQSILYTIIGKDREPLIRDPLCLSLLSLIKAILSLIDSYISLLSLIKAIFQRVSKWGSLSFPMNIVYIYIYV